MPPDMNTLEHRLKKRNTESDDVIQKRLKIAEEEIEGASKFNYVVVNDELQTAVHEINDILNAELEKRNDNN